MIQVNIETQLWMFCIVYKMV